MIPKEGGIAKAMPLIRNLGFQQPAFQQLLLSAAEEWFSAL